MNTSPLNSNSARAVLALGLLAAIASPVNAALSVTTSNSATALVNSIVGSGITVVGGTEFYSGANAGASGTFTGGNDAGVGLGIGSGLILTTGNAVGAVGPNNSDSYTGSGATTTLSFDFTTAGGDLFFNYVFASDEYTEYAGSGFNDSFQFLLDGNNIALIPSTTTPVTINNVNHFSNSAYFKNNDLSFGPAPYNIQYDGFTTVFTASALGLSAGVHSIVLTITDVGDSAYDSAVFIQGNSFSDTPTPVPDSGATATLFVAGLLGLAALRRRLC